jgi:phage terminase large subunit
MTPMIVRIKPGTLNRVYNPHMANQHRYQLYYGGSGSGKSVFLASRCVLDVLQGRNYLIVRQVSRTLRQSCWNEITKAINRMGLREYFNVSKSEMVITAVNNGKQILFAGLDDVEKIKSTTPQDGVLTDIWIEEATETAYADFKQLDKRLRGQSKHKKRLTLSFNPVYKTHWIYTEFFGIWEDGKSYAESDTVSILKTTYKDNRFLADDDRAAMENEKDPYFREVYTLGNWGVLGDVIFRNWRAEDLSGISDAYPTRLYGLDFGFSQDPCAAVDCAYDRKHQRLYIFRELWEKGLTNSMLAERLKTFCAHRPICCDSAEPKSIAEIRNFGISAFPAKKGPDSVVHGIQWLQGLEIVVDVSCHHLREELTTYQWKRDKDGNSMAIPEDKNNHLIDALRYAVETEATQRIATTAKRSVIGI